MNNCTKICYSTFRPVDIVVCVCAGPSIKENLPKIDSYCKARSCVIVSSNYDLHPKTDYITFIDHKIFKKFISRTKCKNIIINSTILKECSNEIKLVKNKNFYQILTDDSIAVCKFNRRAPNYNLDKIRVNKKGRVKHQIGNAGMATIFASHYFRPKEILVLGFDGPTEDNIYIPKYNGKLDKYSDRTFLTIPSKRMYVEKMLVPFLLKTKIKVSAFKNDNFWGIKKNLINWI